LSGYSKEISNKKIVFMFGQNLHKILQAQKISGKELSQITQISQSTISKFLSGDQEPRYSQIISIAKAVQLPPDVFISFYDSQLTPKSPLINELCMIREIFNNHNLTITSLFAFKDFTMEIPMIHDEALFVVVVLEGETDSKLGQLQAGDFRIIKGIDYKGLKVSVHKGTMFIVFIMHESLGDTIRSWTRNFIELIVSEEN
jgi:transcriptional regulator with XRE-family HTH domain